MPDHDKYNLFYNNEYDAETILVAEDDDYSLFKKVVGDETEYWIEDVWFGTVEDSWKVNVDDVNAKRSALRKFYSFIDLQSNRNSGIAHKNNTTTTVKSPIFNYNNYVYQAPAKESGVVDKYCKSNTLVFHKDDPSTRMLCQLYEGKGWDVLTNTYIVDDELKEIINRHDRLVFLGHGTSYGLIGMFGPELVPYFKDKKIFAIWCNADGYFNRYNIGQGQFVTGNMPSEKWESESAGCGNISKELMLENITYWSKLCADVVEDCLEGKVQSSVDYIRKNYLEKYGNHPVTIYNSERTQCLGNSQSLPSYEFKGEVLTEKDFPIPNFDEQEFLKHPVAKASECPTKKVEENN